MLYKKPQNRVEAHTSVISNKPSTRIINIQQRLWHDTANLKGGGETVVKVDPPPPNKTMLHGPKTHTHVHTALQSLISVSPAYRLSEISKTLEKKNK